MDAQMGDASDARRPACFGARRLNRPGFPETSLREYGLLPHIPLVRIESLLECGRWNIAQRLEQPVRVVPCGPGEGGELDVIDAAPGPRRRMTSVLYSPMTLSARALS